MWRTEEATSSLEKSKLKTLEISTSGKSSILIEDIYKKFVTHIRFILCRKGIMKLKRLRQIWIRSLGFWLLREVSIDTAKNQVFEVKDDLRNQDDIDQYMASIMSRHLNIYKPLWEVHVKEDYIENKSVVFVIANHLITDGMGLMSLITFLNDAHNSENIVNHRSISFFYRYIYPIFWIPIGVFEYIIKGLKWKRDINMFPLILKGEIQSNNKVFMQSKQYDFSILKRWYTKFEQMKLNDFLVANITASMANYFNELGIKKLTYFTTSTPINMKSQPRTLDEVKLSNDWAPWLMNIPLSNDINFVMNQNQIWYKNQFKVSWGYLYFFDWILFIEKLILLNYFWKLKQ